MSTPEANPADVAEQRASASRDEPLSSAPEVPLDAPEADVVEQSADAGPGEHLAERDLPLEADEGDAAEQAAVVTQDEDDYR
ncbi:MAG: hypothetical protein QOE99_2947 [Actinomycetota bacterium]|jgi:hypothetical protein|nr:hypothetical protein [Actinomycetota bacterium]